MVSADWLGDVLAHSEVRILERQLSGTHFNLTIFYPPKVAPGDAISSRSFDRETSGVRRRDYITALLRPVSPPSSIHLRSSEPIIRGWLPMVVALSFPLATARQIVT